MMKPWIQGVMLLNRTEFPEIELRDSSQHDWSFLTAIVLLLALDGRTAHRCL